MYDHICIYTHARSHIVIEALVEMDTATRVQILDENVFILHSANILWKV